ncbi:MAG TPA: flagellar hook-associated protein FlgL [Syntrophorhabdaceae bacterium]|nr:flagellar hook-associated protein FlgL [Syntrophorhabdaceae bacterium]
MRIADSLKYEIFTRNLSKIKELVDRTQNQIASGKKVLTPSDDPVAASSGIGLEVEKKINAQYERTLNKLKPLGGFYDTAITGIHDLLTKAKEIAITQASDTMDASTRRSSAEQVKGIIEQLVTIGNTKLGNTFIFGGEKTETTPFTLNDDYTVTYNGTVAVSSVYIDRATKEESGMSGDRVFISDTNIFTVLKGLKDALETNDVDGIKNALNGLDASLDKTETNLSFVGTFVSRIEDYTSYKETRDLDIDNVISSMLDVDITQAVTEFNALSNAYQALLYSMAKIQELNVLNYLK